MFWYWLVKFLLFEQSIKRKFHQEIRNMPEIVGSCSTIKLIIRGMFCRATGKKTLNIVTWRYWMISIFTKISKVRICYTVQIQHSSLCWLVITSCIHTYQKVHTVQIKMMEYTGLDSVNWCSYLSITVFTLNVHVHEHVHVSIVHAGLQMYR